MTLSKPMKAALRALGDLQDRGRSVDLATIQVAAKHYEGGDRIQTRTLEALRREGMVSGPAGWSLADRGRDRLREGL